MKYYSRILKIIFCIFIFSPIFQAGFPNQENISQSTSELGNKRFEQIYNTNNMVLNTPELDPTSKKPDDSASSIAVDSSNNIWVTGPIRKFKQFDYEVITPVIVDGILSKISPDGEIMLDLRIHYDDDDFVPRGISVDSQDNIIVVGETRSNKIAFNAQFPTRNGGWDIALQKYSSDGNLLWSTYFGGSDDDVTPYNPLYIDEEDNILISFATSSDDIPIMNAAYPTRRGDSDGGIARFTPEGNLNMSTYIGGSEDDFAVSTGADTDGNFFTVLQTTSNDLEDAEWINDPSASGGGFDGAIYHFSKNGSLNWAKYIAGSGHDIVITVRSDNNNDVYVIGNSGSSDFPITSSAFDKTTDLDHDAILTKFSQNGTLLYSTFYGGSKFDHFNKADFDSDNNIILIGITGSTDYPISNSSLNVNSLPDGFLDITLTKLSENGIVRFSTHFGGLMEDLNLGNQIPPSIAIDHNGDYIISGESLNPYFPVDGPYPFRFGGERDAFMMKLKSNGSILWSSFALTVTDPELDYDGDGLSNIEEYKLCVESANICVDPTNPDTDGDQMFDGWEWEYGLNPLDRFDAGLDSDFDELDNIIEFQLETEPKINDTDDDGMTDGWEFIMGLDPKTDDAPLDKDDDEMPNSYEFTYRSIGFNASDPADGNKDFDKDGLKNSEEYFFETDPTDRDTDGDGMLDGWEVKYGLNPLDPSDANDDLDGDLFLNKFEHEYGLNPSSKTELIIVLMFVSGIIGFFAWFNYRRRSRTKLAKAKGFLDYKDYQSAKQAGFDIPEDRYQAKILGFHTKEVMQLVQSLGLENADELLPYWNNLIQEIKSSDIGKIIETQKTNLELVSSLESLIENEKEINQIISDLETKIQTLHQTMVFQNKLLTLMKSSSVFVNLEMTDLNAISIITDKTSTMLEAMKGELTDILEEKIIWFEPWSSMLEFIQITVDGDAISISKISEIIRCQEEQAEKLLMMLLNQNSWIGTYNVEQRTYTKGTNINDYLENMLSKVKDFE
ncbi:MAG: hypothetical protein ACXAD7_15685 [Candidatus Kariarchaeaceae archaeon]|jgi:hypothetical protein